MFRDVLIYFKLLIYFILYYKSDSPNNRDFINNVVSGKKPEYSEN